MNNILGAFCLVAVLSILIGLYRTTKYNDTKQIFVNMMQASVHVVGFMLFIAMLAFAGYWTTRVVVMGMIVY